jgi:hypothetical protein
MSRDSNVHVRADRAASEARGSLFRPETMLPEQFFSPFHRRHAGERLLLVAILEDAIKCFQRLLFARNAQQQRLLREAERWIMAREKPARSPDTHPYFSFDQICDVLDLDADDLRAELQRWKRRQLAAPSGRAEDPSGARSRQPVGSEAKVPRPDGPGVQRVA